VTSTSSSDRPPPEWPVDGVVLITGGTGFLGAALARRLLADGARVRILARSAARARELAVLGADIVTGDITDNAAVRAAAAGAAREHTARLPSNRMRARRRQQATPLDRDTPILLLTSRRIGGSIRHYTRGRS